MDHRIDAQLVNDDFNSIPLRKRRVIDDAKVEAIVSRASYLSRTGKSAEEADWEADHDRTLVC